MLNRILVAMLALAAPAALAQQAMPPLPAPPAPATTATPAARPVVLPDTAAIFVVPPELRAEVLRRVAVPGATREQKLHRLAEFIFSDDGLALEYDNSTTRTVAEVWRDGRANCLSFTLLFVALARELGLDAYVQEVGEVLAWYQGDDVVFSATHVNAGIRLGSTRQTADLDANILITRGRPRAISDTRALAHFLNNLGAEWMVEGDLEGAHAALRASLAAAPDFAAAWSNLGVLLGRMGDTAAAEHALLEALRRARHHAPALSNLVHLYRRLGDERQARHYATLLDRLQRTDPFHQFMLALECENNRDYDCAIRHYRRAIRLQEGEHPFHFALARAYFLSGDLERARRELVRAHDLGPNETVRNVYKRKLEHLRRWLDATPTHAALRAR